MSANPVSFRTAFETQIAKLPPEHQTVIRTQMNAITDLQGAIPALKSQIDAIKSGTTSTSTSSGTTTVTENVTTVNNTVSGGAVNNQTGVTAYTVAQNDNGKLLIFSDADAIAVTLNNSVTTPWYCFITNQGAGVVTLTPQQGTINGNANETILDMYFAIIFFDGSQWWSSNIPIVPVNTPAVLHQFLTAYNASTGTFSQAQPAFTDISGTATVAQGGTGATTPAGARANLVAAESGANSDITSLTGLTTPLAVAEGGTGTATPSLVAGTNITITGSFPNQTINASTTGLSVTITTAALTPTGTQGSMTFTAGRLTAQVQAT